MSNKQEYSLDTLEVLKVEINKLREARKKILSLDKLLSQQQKEVNALIKAGCNAKEITNMFQAANIRVGLGKIKKLYFSKKVTNTKPKVSKNPDILPAKNQDENS